LGVKKFLPLLLIAILIIPIVGINASANNTSTMFERPEYVVRPSGFGFSIIVGEGRAGPLKIIYISGNSFDRGYEYGYLAAQEIAGVLNWAYNILGKAMGVPGKILRQKFTSLAKEYEPYIPQEYIEEMKGIAAGFNDFQAEHPNGVNLGYNITYLDVMVINTFVDFSCTGAVISGNLTVDGNPILGTTIDAPPLAPYFVYVVENPEKGHEIAYFTAAGSLFQNGFNDVGLGMIEHHIYSWKGVVGMPEMIRDRYVLQYSDNVSQAIQMFQELFKKYGFSGYGDDVSLSDRYGNIAKLEVTPYRIGYVVNPTKSPTWPKEDPFLRTSAFGMPAPTNYIVYYKVGYSNVLRGKGWIVNGLYTLNATVVGLPGFPSSWQEAINSSKYSWIWEAPERYMIAHYIYDKQLRGEKFSLKDGIIMSQLPLVGDAPYDDGAIWMEPNVGMAVILKGQSSFAKPIFLQTFYPVHAPTGKKPPLMAPFVRKLYNNTVVLVNIAQEVKSILEQFSSNVTLTNTKIISLLGSVSHNITTFSNEIMQKLNEISSSCNKILNQQSALLNEMNSLKGTVESSNKTVESSSQEIEGEYHKLIGLEVAVLILVIITLGVASSLAITRRSIS